MWNSSDCNWSRQMKRRFFNILTAVSAILLLPCVATMGLWILSIWVGTEWNYCSKGEGPYFVVMSADGCIDVEYEPINTGVGSHLTEFHEFANDVDSIFRWNHLGFNVHLDSHVSHVVIPDWFICSITAVLPFLWYRSYRQRRLAERKGLCITCGYDLRATPDRCPECGTPLPLAEARQ
jgi:hypothetical protein